MSRLGKCFRLREIVAGRWIRRRNALGNKNFREVSCLSMVDLFLDHGSTRNFTEAGRASTRHLVWLLAQSIHNPVAIRIGKGQRKDLKNVGAVESLHQLAVRVLRRYGLVEGQQGAILRTG